MTENQTFLRLVRPFSINKYFIISTWSGMILFKSCENVFLYLFWIVCTTWTSKENKEKAALKRAPA